MQIMFRRSLLVGLMVFSCAATLNVDFMFAQSGRTQEIEDQLAAAKLDASTMESLKTFIEPDESELAWKKIPWLVTFKEGVVAGGEQGKPILLWTMNGHPLGCT